MTGYGRSVKSGAKTAMEVVVSSFNKRTLDITLKVSPELIELESFIRKTIGELFERGAIFVSLREVEGGGSIEKDPLLVVAEQRFLSVNKIATHLGLTLSDGEIFSAVIGCAKESLILLEKDQDKQKEKVDLAKSALSVALQEVQEGRKREGSFLKADLSSRLDTLFSLREQIFVKKGDVVALQVERLSSLLEPYIKAPLLTDERLLKEAVLYADKMDISEEVSRIGHHIEHCRSVLEAPGALGKKIDFLLQELMREFNTLGAKALNVAITVLVVQAKVELEKMREQVQNVE
jgi:uncharacterized protein (TIGR00255 family)